MKKVLQSLVIIMLISSMFTITAFADVFDWHRYSCVSPESQLLPPTEKSAIFKYQSKARGDFIAAADLSISNEGGGKIGIYAQTLAYVPLDKCRMRIYLDQWDEEKQRWAMVDQWDFNFEKSNDPETPLLIPVVSFNVTNQPTGFYYRLRGLHAVWVGGNTEGFSTQTNGVFISK